jgi:hypothetical protein
MRLFEAIWEANHPAKAGAAPTARKGLRAPP